MDRRDFLRNVGAAGALCGATAALSACGAPPTESPEGDPAPTAAPAQQSARPFVEWRMSTSWPQSLGVLDGTARQIARRVAAMTEGHFIINVFSAGEEQLVAPLDVFDAVQQGDIECCHTVLFYFLDKHEALSIATGLPFGFTPQQQNAWLLYGGGREAIQNVLSDFAIRNLTAGNTGTQMGGWFNREVNVLADLEGLKFRIPGLGGEVMQQLGVETVVLSAMEIYDALDHGAIDAAEWVGPHDDEKLGLHEVAEFYYYPGWWEPGTSTDMLINQQAWDALPPLYQEVLETASHEVNVTMLAQYEMLNQEALARMVAGGVQLRPYSEEILVAAKDVAFALYEELASTNPDFKAVFEPWKAFRRNIYQWSRFNELSFAKFATSSVF